MINRLMVVSIIIILSNIFGLINAVSNRNFSPLKSIIFYLQSECISNAFGQYVRNTTNEVYKKCSLPWTMSALGHTMYNPTVLQGCSFDDGIKQNDANIEFFFAAKNYNVSGCKGIYTNYGIDPKIILKSFFVWYS